LTPSPVRDAFNYCMCLLMVEADKMRLVDTMPGESGELCTFETVTGDTFSIARPPMSQVCKFIPISAMREQILEALPGIPIMLLWDRAPWHRGQPIQDVLDANPRLQIIWLPTAAPDLNPQEHVWKATRRAITHNHLTPRLPDLADRFEHHLTSNTFESSFLDRYGYNSFCPMFK
jgi:hypothetical protein